MSLSKSVKWCVGTDLTDFTGQLKRRIGKGLTAFTEIYLKNRTIKIVNVY